MRKLNEVFLLSILMNVVPPSTPLECKKLTACSCQSSEGIIDLTPIAGFGSPKFADLPGPEGTFLYTWNPCNDFSVGTSVSQSCANVAACQSDTAGTQYYNLGDQASAKFISDPDHGLTLQYNAVTDFDRTAIVTLTCDQSQDGTLTIQGDPKNDGHYFMTLTSKYACPTDTPDPGVTINISVGSVIAIVLFAAVFLYIIFGTLLNVVVRKAQGREMIPNYEVWTRIMGYIRDGFIFTFTLGRRSGYNKL